MLLGECSASLSSSISHPKGKNKNKSSMLSLYSFYLSLFVLLGEPTLSQTECRN